MKLVVHRLLCAFWICVAGCSGGGSAGDDNEDNAGGSDGAGGAPPPAGACDLPRELLPQRRVIRLSPQQYANALKANFGFKMDVSRLPPDAPSGDGFAVFDSNFADKQITPEHFTVFRETAEAVASDTARTLQGSMACLFNKPDDGCVAAFLSDVGQRAFRRPPSEQELARYQSFFRSVETKWDSPAAVRLVLEAMLQSPAHLYRTELGGGDADKVALTQYELANELSFMLADAPPDEALLAAAKAGKLKDADEVKQHAERLLATDTSRARLASMFGQMYGVTPSSAETLGKDATAYPGFTPALRAAMMKETQTFVQAVLQDDASLKTIFGADFSYLNNALAAHYGANTAGLGDEFKKVSLPEGRRGLLGHASVLSVNAHKDGSSPAIRGIAIYTKLLCQPIPAAPPGAVDLANGKIYAPDKNFTQREHYEFAKQKAPECIGCHGQFVPLGLGLEQFDGVGAQRSSEFGKPLNTKVQLEGYGDDVDGTYDSTLPLIDKLVQSDHGARCFATQAASFAYGQDVSSDTMDSCETKRLASTLKDKNFSVTQLMLDLTQVESFYNRRQGS
ncbi:MAG: DUF1592 domain-containing protein [Deltaproteobacteria bacterium]|nr:DUF1592 domain-containing protein [Deltaproteobacteria bacterium]